MHKNIFACLFSVHNTISLHFMNKYVYDVVNLLYYSQVYKYHNTMDIMCRCNNGRILDKRGIFVRRFDVVGRVIFLICT